jgi:hypothetical protein
MARARRLAVRLRPDPREGRQVTPRAPRWDALKSPAALLPRLRRPPLPLTSLALLLLLLLPALQLWRLPRPRAVGLEQLLGQASLLQSFPPTPERPVPALWRERLGAAQAESLWRRQRGPWWQFWGQHTDAAPLLAFSASSLAGGPAAALPANGLRVGDLVVVAADPLSRQLLRDRLLPQQRLSRGLDRRCLERLRQDQAVLWNANGLGGITGPVAPLLQRLSRGCLSFALAGDGLIWQGEAGDGEGLLAPLAADPGGTSDPLPPLPVDRLLELEGASTDLLLDGLLTRPLIRDPLSRRYGLDAARLALLRRTPFRLQLRPLPKGPFQASLELQLPVGRQEQAWQALLEQLSRTLVEQGLTPVAAVSGASGTATPGAAGAAMPAASGSSGTGPGPGAAQGTNRDAEAPGPAQAGTAQGSRREGGSVSSPTGVRPAASDAGATWKRPDGVIVGGWRWIRPSRREPQLLVFLGPVPAGPLLPIAQQDSPLPGPGGLRLRSRPQSMQALGLLPADVPELVRRADQLWMVSQSPAGSDPSVQLSRLTGGLQVPR